MKDFDIWNLQKQNIENHDKKFLFKERDIIFIKMGKNIGYEKNGKGLEFIRPVVVVRKFNKNIFWGMPLTSKPLVHKNKYYMSLGEVRGTSNWAILSQGRSFDIKRAKHKIGMLDKKIFEKLKQKTKEILFH